jgi:hypothetical protein
MKVHRNLLWLRGVPELLDELLADRTMATLLRARPTPGLCGFAQRDHERLVRQLEKLGQAPRERGTW